MRPIKMRGLALAIAALLVGATGAESHLRRREGSAFEVKEDGRYAMMIDAGSSGSRGYIYEYKWKVNETTTQLPVVNLVIGQSEWSKRSSNALTANLSYPDSSVRASLEEIMVWGKQLLGDKYKETELWLKATAGVRTVEDATQRDALMAAARSYLGGLGWSFRSAEVISGRNEGQFAWISANYLADRFASPSNGHSTRAAPNTTVGILDMGGASVQYGYQVDPTTIEEGDGRFRTLTTDQSRSYTIFTDSYDGYGSNSARLSVIDNALSESNVAGQASMACYPKGYQNVEDGLKLTNIKVVGTGNFSECLGQIRRALFADQCLGGCPAGWVCGANSACMPPRDKGLENPLVENFWAWSTFLYASDFFKTFFPTTSDYQKPLTGFRDSGYEYFNLTLPQLENWVNGSACTDCNKAIALKFVSSYGFQASYAYLLLESLQFSLDDENIAIVNKPVNHQGNPTSMGWALGAVINELSAIQQGTGPSEAPVGEVPITGPSTSGGHIVGPSLVAVLLALGSTLALTALC